MSKVTLFVHFQAGQGKKGTDKAVFVEILTTRNYAQLRATFDAYKSVSIDIFFGIFHVELTLAGLKGPFDFVKKGNLSL